MDIITSKSTKSINEKGLDMETDEIKQKIVDEIAKTEKIVADYKEMTQPISPDDAIGRVSRMDAINNKSIVEASLRKAEDKLRGLQHVLSQLGTKEFGLCIMCNNPIPLGRILFRPESVYCVNCAK